MLLKNVLTDIIDYRGKTPLKLGLNWDPNGSFLALSAKNVKTGKLINLKSANRGNKNLYNKWMLKEVEKGDILLTSEAPFGEAFYWDYDEKIILSQRLFCLKIDKTKIIPRYLFYLICSTNFQDQLKSKSTGSTVIGLRQPALLSCHINVHLPNEQQHIVNTI